MTDYERHLFRTIHWSTAEDNALFREFTRYLPKRGPGMPYHSGPQNISRFADMISVMDPSLVVEIGFNLGHSAAIMLGLGVEKVISIQPAMNEKTEQAIDALASVYGDRFRFVLSDSTGSATFIPQPDILFIDGDHSYGWVMKDIAFGRELRAHAFFLDDYDSHHGPGVIKAVEDSNLVVRALFGTMALCVTRHGLCLRHDPEATEFS